MTWQLRKQEIAEKVSPTIFFQDLFCVKCRKDRKEFLVAFLLLGGIFHFRFLNSPSEFFVISEKDMIWRTYSQFWSFFLNSYLLLELEISLRIWYKSCFTLDLIVNSFWPLLKNDLFEMIFKGISLIIVKYIIWNVVKWEYCLFWLLTCLHFQSKTYSNFFRLIYPCLTGLFDYIFSYKEINLKSSLGFQTWLISSFINVILVFSLIKFGQWALISQRKWLSSISWCNVGMKLSPIWWN